MESVKLAFKDGKDEKYIYRRTNRSNEDNLISSMEFLIADYFAVGLRPFRVEVYSGYWATLGYAYVKKDVRIESIEVNNRLGTYEDNGYGSPVHYMKEPILKITFANQRKERAGVRYAIKIVKDDSRGGLITDGNKYNGGMKKTDYKKLQKDVERARGIDAEALKKSANTLLSYGEQCK